MGGTVAPRSSSTKTLFPDGVLYTDLQLSFNQHIIYLSRFYTLLWSGHIDNTGLVGEALTKYCWPNTPTPWGALVPPLNVTTLVPDSISHTQTFQSCPDVSLVNKIYQQIYVFIWTISKRTKRYDIKDSYKKWKSKWIFERGTYLYVSLFWITYTTKYTLQTNEALKIKFSW